MAGITDLCGGAGEVGAGGGSPRGGLDISHNARLEAGWVQRASGPSAAPRTPRGPTACLLPCGSLCSAPRTTKPFPARSSGGGGGCSGGRAHPRYSTPTWRERQVGQKRPPVILTAKGARRSGRGRSLHADSPALRRPRGEGKCQVETVYSDSLGSQGQRQGQAGILEDGAGGGDLRGEPLTMRRGGGHLLVSSLLITASAHTWL